MHYKRTLIGVTLASSLLAGACSGQILSSSPTAASSTTASVATGIAISGGMTLNAKGETRPLAAMVTFADGTVQDRTTATSWSSTAETVATVNAAGVVTAVTDGRTTINATFGSLSASKLIVVDLP
jgi:transketolase N-terminal domain/subunit